MANSKKKIILNEILFWKQNKLLPDHYCDFLMTLYSEGNEIEVEDEISHKKSIIAKQKQNNMLLIAFISIISISLLATLFMISEIAWLVGAGVGIIAIVLMVIAYRFAKKKEIMAPVLHIASALLLFGVSVKMSIQYFPENQFVLYGLLILNCLMWFFTGYKFKLMYFTVSGAVGLLFLIGYQIVTLQ